LVQAFEAACLLVSAGLKNRDQAKARHVGSSGFLDWSSQVDSSKKLKNLK
jgi:hypothetical protein